VDADLSSLPDDIDALKAALIAARTEAAAEKACAVAAAAELAQGRALIAHLNLEIEKLRRTIYGPRSERTARLLDQLELQLEEAEATAAEDELAAEHTKPSTTVRSFARKRPARKPFPDHLPRERVVIPAPQSCPCCGSAKLSKLGEDITETLEVVPRQWKVIQTVRERFSCRECEDDHPAAGALPCDAARLRWPQSAGDDPVREVWSTSAAQSLGRALRPRRRGS
jgi:transposase